MRLFGIEISATGAVDRLRENLADLERQFEDMNWMSFSSLGGFSQMFKESYKKIVLRSRKAYAKNPIIGHAINLTTDYVFGEGITTPKANSNEDATDNEEVQELLDRFWNDPDNNMSLTSSVAQRSLSNKLQYDGEVNFRLFVDSDGAVYVRILDPLGTQPIHDKTDPMRVNFWTVWKGTKKYYIPDASNGIALSRDSDPEAWAIHLKENSIVENRVVSGEYIFHVQINADINDGRGVPLPWRALDWINDHTRLHSDMSSFIHAQAQYAWKKKIKGSKAQVQAFKNRGAQNTSLTNPSFQAGSTLIENASVENKPIDLKSGSGQLFTTGIKAVFRMITIAFGLFEHYFGDLGNANLATAKSVELPMLKKFRSLQKFWEDTIIAILWFQLDRALYVLNTSSFEYIASRNRLRLKEGADFKLGRNIDVDFPPILQQDIKELAEGWSIAKKEGLAPIDTSRSEFMVGAGINNIDIEMQKEFQEPSAAPSPFGPAQESRVKEAGDEGVEPKDFTSRRRKALKLADKNTTVLSKMKIYLNEIGVEYRKMKSAIRGAARTKESGVKIKGLRSKLNTFKEKMNRLAEKHFPGAAEIGFDYASKRIDVKEVAILREQSIPSKFVDSQIAENAKFLDGLTDDMFVKMSALSEATYKSAEFADEALADAINSYEKRIGSYAGYYWTVEERAVKETGSASPKTEVVFVGVDDDANCDGCQEGLDGNPWTMEGIPVPGEQECLTACRHAIQVSGDEPLTESDKQVLRDAESEARDGYILESDRSGYTETIHNEKLKEGCSCCGKH